tara:strand:+ start:413 stop:2518 length:2106 start_codon:yes stop_codon:yes gene_type:complete
MQVVELYINNTRVDLFKDESVTITDTIVNAKDVAKVFTTFSQQFSLPASSPNNLIFKHYYNWNITLGSFDARVRVSAILKLNGVDFKIGKVKLNSVSMKNNKAYSYKVIFYGETITLNDTLGEDKLSALSDLNTLSLNYNTSKIKEKLQVDPATNDIITPLITSGASGTQSRLFYNSDNSAHLNDTGNLYYHTGSSHDHGVLFSDLKYALRLHRIIQAIQVNYPSITFSNNFFVNTNEAYYDLFMWLHRKSGSVSNGDQISTFPTSVNGWTSSGSFICGASENWGGMSSVSTLTVCEEFASYSDSSTLFQLTLSTSSTNKYAVEVLQNGVSIYAATGLGGNTTIKSTSGVFQELGNTTVSAGEWTVIITVTAVTTFSNITWTLTNNEPNEIPVTLTFPTGSFLCDTNFEFAITQQIPDIKIIDFLTGLFKLFNLVAYTEEDGTIFVDTLDSFYATSNTYDISKYIDVNTSAVDVALPYRKINFTYEGLDTFLAAQWEQLNVAKWGAESYEAEGGLDGGIYSVVAPFEHMQFERLLDIEDESGETPTTIQWGFCVNDNQQAYIGKPILFYPILKTGGSTTPISFRDTPTSHSEVTSYNLPSNSVSLSASTSTANINFGNMINEFTGLNNFTGTLYNNYYSSYIENLFLQGSRLVKYTAYLPLDIILNYTLADILIVNGQQFRINSLNINLTNNKSQIELITI